MVLLPEKQKKRSGQLLCIIKHTHLAGSLYNLYQKFTNLSFIFVLADQSYMTNFVMFNSPGLVIYHFHLLYLKLNNLEGKID